MVTLYGGPAAAVRHCQLKLILIIIVIIIMKILIIIMYALYASIQFCISAVAIACAEVTIPHNIKDETRFAFLWSLAGPGSEIIVFTIDYA